MSTSLKGTRFGVLTVTRDINAGGVRRRVTVACVCGETSTATVNNLQLHPHRRFCGIPGCGDRQRQLAARSVAS